MSKLGVTDYKKILEFSSQINSDYDRFVQNTLTALADLFGYRLSAYTILQMGGNQETFVEGVYSRFIGDEILDRYKNEGHARDLFCRRLLYRMSSFSLKYAYTIHDVATEEEFFGTSYGRWMRDMNLSQRVVLKAPDVRFPCHMLTIYKAQPDGALSPYEFELLNELGRVFSEAGERYRAWLGSRRVFDLLDSYFTFAGTGLAAIDAEDNVLYNNNQFSRHASNISERQNINAMVLDLVSIVLLHNQITMEDITATPVYCLVNGYRIDLYIDRMFHGSNLETCLFLTTRKSFDPAQSVKYNQKLTEQFGFTMRELEIIDFILKGCSNAQMAEDLYITTSTVKFHIKNIFSKLNVTTRSAAISKILTFK